MSTPFKIIIVGGGISGLMTAIQLEMAGMDYVVLEKAQTASPLGSALSLTPSCSYIFDQLGMLDDLKKVLNPCAKIDYIRDDLTKIGVMNSGSNKERYGYDAILIARPDFYNVLLSRLPKERIHWGKRVIQFYQSQDGV
ncbi:hypothetical protein BGZ81_008454 [Podila clonocystis]|nr:hypothetical protein BGZ81_008454 [Podila clonocystis]